MDVRTEGIVFVLIYQNMTERNMADNVVRGLEYNGYKVSQEVFRIDSGIEYLSIKVE